MLKSVVEYDRILRGGSKVSNRWFIDPAHVGPMSQKNFYHITFSATSWNYILLIFLYVDREREMFMIHAKFWSFAN